MADSIARCVLAGVGAAIFLVGLRLARRAFRLTRSGITTTATVVTHEGDAESRFSVVEYDDKSGVRHRARLRGSLQSIGQTVPVVYDPAEPGRPSGTSSWDL